jgi:hypothetical protein
VPLVKPVQPELRQTFGQNQGGGEGSERGHFFSVQYSVFRIKSERRPVAEK